MKRNVMDTTNFPIRKVVSVRDVQAGSKAAEMAISHFLTLDCGHEVGVNNGAFLPDTVACYRCHKEGKQ